MPASRVELHRWELVETLRPTSVPLLVLHPLHRLHSAPFLFVKGAGRVSINLRLPTPTPPKEPGSSMVRAPCFLVVSHLLPVDSGVCLPSLSSSPGDHEPESRDQI